MVLISPRSLISHLVENSPDIHSRTRTSCNWMVIVINAEHLTCDPVNPAVSFQSWNPAHNSLSLELAYCHVFWSLTRLTRSIYFFIDFAPPSSTSSLPSLAGRPEGLMHRPPTAASVCGNPQRLALHPFLRVLGVSLESY